MTFNVIHCHTKLQWVTIGDLHTFEFAVRSKMTIAQIKYGIADADKLHA